MALPALNNVQYKVHMYIARGWDAHKTCLLGTSRGFVHIALGRMGCALRNKHAVIGIKKLVFGSKI